MVGEILELGNWDANKFQRIFLNPNYPEWYLPISVPINKKINFKFVKKDVNGKVIWEDNIPNRNFNTSSNPTGVVDTPLYTWNQ